MLSLQILENAGPEPTVLFLGAHSDDIEIGCGGTALRLVESYPTAKFHWVVFSADDDREVEARSSAAGFLENASNTTVEVLRFRESYFPSVHDQLKDEFERLKGRVNPDLIFTHRLEDRHQDHRTISELTHNTYRDHFVLEYEIPKFDGDLGKTPIYVPLNSVQMDSKVNLLMENFASQKERSWFDPDTFRGLGRIRGVECNSPGRFAEGFCGRTVVMGFDNGAE